MDLSTYRYFKQLHIQQVLALTYYLRQLSRKFAENRITIKEKTLLPEANSFQSVINDDQSR